MNAEKEVTESEITGLAPGTYYVKMKAAGTMLASDYQELKIENYLNVVKEAEKAVKAVKTKAEKTPVITKEPTARNLTCTDSPQELVYAGSATGDTMQYALGTDATTAPESGWSQSIPTGTKAGTYYVWYKHCFVQ